ncbi:glutamyl-tRNA synthetase [Spongiibacter sp. IMCC21906]|uniref:glutamate--tRNA ligase n=1 Tax=Spongiibacter sp. IMCC21906 TaxID=1620392 RepID=UPI00062DCB9E|nr:glutamate--tRNA ligase [Spongiibacter sp. IMCC21906]AKH69615.1 glutamyl-tRNA synthetase [Spongiibacter sp. IMCC21906]
MTVRTRIAPSPTGDPHVGTAYIALFNYCFAKSQGGEFLLRIEDTDQQRSTAASEKAILDSLRWLGLDWDEGPDVGGPSGPYRQSERSDIYQQHCQQLIDQGKAFRCYRTAEELNTLRESRREAGLHTALKASDLRLSEEEVQAREAAGAAYVIRMVVPEEDGRCEIDDMLRGKIELEWSQVDAQILLKSDGLPTYHLANVVDDHLMGITHVLRGEEWINSAPKHKLLYEYFGWEMPQLCHLPLLRNPDKSKLSKRKNPTSILYYQRMGFMPEALLNYLGRMGWSMPDESEKFNLATMLENFDVSRVSLGGPIFDVEKLRWLNGLWLREDLDQEQLAQRLMEWALNKETLAKILPHAQSRIEVFSDLAPLAAFFLSGMLPISPESFSACNLDEEELVSVLQAAAWRLEAEQDWQRDTLFAAIKSLADGMEIKLKDFMPPLFIAIAGTTASISVVDSMEVLGPEMSRARLRYAVDVLGGLGKKRLKKLEKRYQQALQNSAG